MRRILLLLSVAAACTAVVTGPAAAKSGIFSIEQSASLVQPGNHSSTAVQLSTTGTPFTWGAADLSIPSGVTLNWLTNLSTDYKFVSGSCWGGSPRFEIWVTDPSGASHKVFLYIGPPPSWTGCALGVWANTGNLVTPSSFIDDSQLGGNTMDNVANAMSNYGSYPVTAIYLDADGGWAGNQVVDFDNAQINHERFAFDPGDQVPFTGS